MTLDYVSIISDESSRLVRAYELDRGAAIPWSDRWTVGTVARHVAGTHHVVADIVRGQTVADVPLPPVPVPPVGELDEGPDPEPDEGCWNIEEIEFDDPEPELVELVPWVFPGNALLPVELPSVPPVESVLAMGTPFASVVVAVATAYIAPLVPPMPVATISGWPKNPSGRT